MCDMMSHVVKLLYALCFMIKMEQVNRYCKKRGPVGLYVPV